MAVLAALPDPLRDGAIIETSGSTGGPKRVVLSPEAFQASAVAAAEALGAPGDWVLALPTNYVAGLNVIARADYMGTEVLTAVGGPSFSAMGFAAVVLGAEGTLYTSIVPIQLQRLLDSAPGLEALKRLDRVLLGGQAPDPALLRRARAEGIDITVTYGASETCGGIVWDGRPIGDARYRLIDGVVHLTGPSLADGYLDDPERTAAAFPIIDGVRWHRTNDFGEERAGRLFVLGRLDDVIVSGGVKVSLAEVEFAARSFGLPDAVAVAVDHGEWGQAPAIVATADAELEALREHIAANLGAAARPTAFHRVAAIPRLASGKPDRIALAAIAKQAGE